jgi:hypothetical protein
LNALWLNALRTWMRDDSDDMAKTMATLDRGLGRAERLSRFLPGRRSMDEAPIT